MTIIVYSDTDNSMDISKSKKTFTEKLGFAIGSFRTMNGIHSLDFCKKVGIGHATLSAIEGGKNIQTSSYDKIEKAYDVDLVELLVRHYWAFMRSL